MSPSPGSVSFGVDKQSKWLDSKAAAADMLVAVHAAAKRLLAIVEMKDFDALMANQPVEFAHRRLILLLRRERVPRGKYVTRIQADADPLRVGHKRKNLCQVLKAMTERTALTRGGFQ